MKMSFKNIKLNVTSPNASFNGEFHIEDISFEANLQEISEILKGGQETMKVITDSVNSIVDKVTASAKEVTKCQTDENIREARTMDILINDKISSLKSAFDAIKPAGMPFGMPFAVKMTKVEKEDKE